MFTPSSGSLKILGVLTFKLFNSIIIAEALW